MKRNTCKSKFKMLRVIFPPLFKAIASLLNVKLYADFYNMKILSHKELNFLKCECGKPLKYYIRSRAVNGVNVFGD